MDERRIEGEKTPEQYIWELYKLKRKILATGLPFAEWRQTIAYFARGYEPPSSYKDKLDRQFGQFVGETELIRLIEELAEVGKEFKAKYPNDPFFEQAEWIQSREGF